MNSKRSLVLAATLLLSGQMAYAQDVSRYRVYVLESTVDSVIAASGARSADVRSLHARPARIQELQWRAPHGSRDTLADPVRDIAFSFYDDALYRVVVNYERDRTEGLTSKEILDTLSRTYGVPVSESAQTRTSAPAEVFLNHVVLARWENGDSLATLIRGTYSPEYQLILVSKSLSARASTAIKEAIRLDGIEAPIRESEQRKKEATDASAARDKARAANKEAFRP